MKLEKAIGTFRHLCHNAYTDDDMIGWISELDGMVIRDVFEGREDSPVPADWAPYTAENLNAELLIPQPYDVVYMDWLKAKVDYWQGESTYSNSYKSFNNAYMAFGDWWRRNHAPLVRNQWKLLGRDQ